LTSIPYWIQNWEMMMQAYPGSAWVVPMILMGLVMYALTIVSFILLVFKKKIAYYIAMAAVILFIITFLLNMITQQVFNPVVTFIIVLLIIEALFIHKSKPLLK
jgi:hypothetical protein